MVVNSPLIPANTKSPIKNIWVGTTCGCQRYGTFARPVANNIGLGDWHNLSLFEKLKHEEKYIISWIYYWLVKYYSSDGSAIKSLTTFHKGLSLVVPCRKSNAPGPSVVPAAKL